MAKLTNSIQELIDLLAQLPGIGRKTAMRLAFYIVRERGDYAQRLSEALTRSAHNITFCEQCANFTDTSPCALCSQAGREQGIICVVSSPQDILAIEKTGEYNGLYHVLHGLISPLNGIGPNDLHIASLLRRLSNNNVKELILASNPSVEGEATALYIKKLVENHDLIISRIASGIPMGSEIEYADSATLGRSLLQRRVYD